MSIVAFMTCAFCGHPATCTSVDGLWVCKRCRPAAEGARVYKDAA